MSGFVYKHRVRYADTDQMGVAYHGRYFEWFEAARTEFLRSLGIAYKDVETSGIAMPVIEAGCRYRRPIYYDEVVKIIVRIGELTRSRLRLEYDIDGDYAKTRAAAFTVHCFVKNGIPVRIPAYLDKILNK